MIKRIPQPARRWLTKDHFRHREPVKENVLVNPLYQDELLDLFADLLVERLLGSEIVAEQEAPCRGVIQFAATVILRQSYEDSDEFVNVTQCAIFK